MRLVLQNQTLEHKNELKQVENKKSTTVAELQSQINEALQEISKLKEQNAALKEEVKSCKKAASEAVFPEKTAHKEMGPLSDPSKLVEAARNMKLAEIQYVHYQVYNMLNSMYKMYPHPGGYYPY